VWMSLARRSPSIVQNAAAGSGSHPRRGHSRRGVNPIGQSGFHPNALPEQEQVRFEAWPAAEPGCHRNPALALELPASAPKLPAATPALPGKAAELPSGERPNGIRRNAELAQVKARTDRRRSPVRPSFGRCCPGTKAERAAAPDPQRPWKPKA
jgi:hypothetical protein